MTLALNICLGLGVPDFQYSGSKLSAGGPGIAADPVAAPDPGFPVNDLF